ncbi:MAG TPA: DUF4190 domain-containing protein [Cellulomonas sp.]
MSTPFIPPPGDAEPNRAEQHEPQPPAPQQPDPQQPDASAPFQPAAGPDDASRPAADSTQPYPASAPAPSSPYEPSSAVPSSLYPTGPVAPVGPPQQYAMPQPGYAQPGYVQPGYVQPGYPQPGQPYPYATAPVVVAPQRSIALAIAGMVTALVPCISLVGLVLSIVALVQARKDGRGRGMAVTGTVVGALWVLLVVFSLIWSSLEQSRICDGLGYGTHDVDGTLYTCG